MSIEHATFSAIRHEGLHTVTLPSEVIRAIGHSDAVAIWTYLHTMSANWQPKREQIKQALGLGEHRYRNGMKRLRQLDLVFNEDVRAKDGRIVGKTMVVIGIPRNIDDFIQKANSHVDGHRQHGVIDNEETQQHGDPTPISTDQVLSTDQDQDHSLSKARAQENSDLSNIKEQNKVDNCQQTSNPQESYPATDLQLDDKFKGIAKMVGYTGDIPACFLAFQGDQMSKAPQLLTDTQWMGHWQKWVAREKGWQKAPRQNGKRRDGIERHHVKHAPEAYGVAGQF